MLAAKDSSFALFKAQQHGIGNKQAQVLTEVSK